MKLFSTTRGTRPLVTALISLLRIAVPLGLIAGAAVWFLNLGATSTGSLRVTSSVPGADIYIAGVQTTSSTDALLTGIPVGRQMVTVRMPGYISDPEVIIVEVTKDRIAHAGFVLHNASEATKTDSIPPMRAVRQEIFSTGEPIRMIPPAPSQRSLVDYSPDDNEPEDETYTEESEPDMSYTEPSAPTAPIMAKERRALTGTQITVSSNPIGAEIVVNNAPTPHVTPHSFHGLDRGVYVFGVKKSGYKAEPDSIVVSLSRDDQSELVDFSLNPDKLLPKPIAKIQTTPLAAGIKVDGEIVGVGNVTIGLEFGEHTAEFVPVPGYASPAPKTFALSPDAPSAEITGEYVRVQGNAFLAVVPGDNVTPFDSKKLRVYVDNELIIDGPKEKFDVTLVGSLMPGSRVVKISYGDLTEEMPVDLSDGEVTEITFRLESTFSKRKLRLREKLDIPLDKWQAKYKKSTVLSQS